MKIAIVGAGWAGMAAAVEATIAGHNAIVFEAAPAIGGRARAVFSTLPHGAAVTLDNGQHILIGAYTESLRLMRQVGVNPNDALLSQPMALVFPDGLGIRFPAWPTPLDALGGIAMARGWTLADKCSLMRAALGWQIRRFRCAPETSVAQLCQALTPRVLAELIEPLCVSALNTPAPRASGQVFLRVMQDALFGVQGGSRLLLPKVDLSELFPGAAARWLQAQGGEVRIGKRVETLAQLAHGWQIQGERFDAVLIATSAAEAARMLENSAQSATFLIADQMREWARSTGTLQYEAISTVYAWAAGAALARPMLALRPHPGMPAQFAFDRGQLGGPPGLLAFVVSASTLEREVLQTQVLEQAQQQLGLSLLPVQTIVEKRATFACTPGLQRPPQALAPGLVVCGDYVAGPYPATLEGAIRSAVSAVASLQADEWRVRG